MTEPQTSSPDGIARLFVSGLLAILGLCGLLASLCGGYFTLWFITGRGAGPFFLAISLPSLLIGGAIAWACFRGLRGRLGPRT